jgi:pimeloyl-ACP methyl ester carboxylesterase
MKSLILVMLRSYFALLSFIWPARAGLKAFYLFQKTRRLPVRKAERDFFEQAEFYELAHPRENIPVYEMGDRNGKLVILVHGWESHAGSMGALAVALAAEGNRVVLLDLPAHGRSRLVRTNLRDCREALRALIFHLRPVQPFSIVTHSFGSAVASFALADSRYQVDTFIMLTSPNRLIDIFRDFARLIGLGKSAFEYVLRRADEILQESVRLARVEDKVARIPLRKLVVIHDRYDKIIPYANATAIAGALPEAELITLENAGHYRMLWNQEVINTVTMRIAATESVHEPLAVY